MIRNIDRLNFTYRVIKNGKVIDRCQTHFKRRFTNQLRTLKWQELKKFNGSVYLRVSYGKQEDCFGKTVTFYNDGLYKNEKYLWLAFRTFIEK